MTWPREICATEQRNYIQGTREWAFECGCSHRSNPREPRPWTTSCLKLEHDLNEGLPIFETLDEAIPRLRDALGS